MQHWFIKGLCGLVVRMLDCRSRNDFDFDLELLESHTQHAKYIDTSCMYLSCHNDNVAMIKASILWCND